MFVVGVGEELQEFGDGDIHAVVAWAGTRVFGLLLAVFGLLIYYGYKVSINAKDRFGCYLGVGITSILAVQVLLNVAVVSGAVPPTGLPLPFISAGSTSLIMFMAGMGILANIAKSSGLRANTLNYSQKLFVKRKKEVTH